MSVQSIVDELELMMQWLPEQAVDTMREALAPGGRQLKVRRLFPDATEDELLKLASLDFVMTVLSLERDALAEKAIQ